MEFLNRNLSTCVITAGGQGTRLLEITKDIPKPLFPINGLSCLERSIKIIINFGITKIYILSCYKKNILKEKVEILNSKYRINIKLIYEEQPLGECGGLWLIKNELKNDILFLNSDLVWDIDIRRFFIFHVEHQSDITLLTHTCTHPKDSDLISEFSNKQIFKFSLKPHKGEYSQEMFLGNSGIALFNSQMFESLNIPKGKPSFCNHILNSFKKSNLKVFSYNTTEFVKDVGTPKRFKEVELILKKGLVSSKSYRNPQKCLFLDRDNTLISCPIKEYITNKNQIKFLENNIIKISELRSNYNFAIILTNQPQISMGLISWQDVIKINSFIIQKCLEFGLKIDGFNVCPHHYHAGFVGEVSELKQECFCRKPKPGLFLDEAYFRNISLSQSLMIGDSEVDKIAANRAGCEFLNVANI